MDPIYAVVINGNSLQSLADEVGDIPAIAIVIIMVILWYVAINWLRTK